MNKRNTLIIMLVIFLAFIGGLFLFDSNIDKENQSNNLRIAATVFPLQDIAKNIVKDKVDIQLILPPGANPHTFEFTPRQVKELRNVKVIFAIGHGLDSWVNRIENSLFGTKIIIADKNIALRQSVEIFSDDQEEEKGPIDPHYWLTLPNVKIIARNIADEIIAIDEDNKEFYEKNFEIYASELDLKDKEFKDKLRNIPDKNIITLHDAWYYFAQEYGINIAGTFEPSAGREPTPRYLARLKQAAEENNIKTIFSEPQVSTAALEPFAKDFGLSIQVLDPIEGVTSQSYLEGMGSNVDILIESF